MTGWGWFWTVVCIVFWIAFFLLVRETGKMGMKSYKLGAFWFTLVSISVLSILILVLVVQDKL